MFCRFVKTVLPVDASHISNCIFVGRFFEDSFSNFSVSRNSSDSSEPDDNADVLNDGEHKEYPKKQRTL